MAFVDQRQQQQHEEQDQMNTETLDATHRETFDATHRELLESLRLKDCSIAGAAEVLSAALKSAQLENTIASLSIFAPTHPKFTEISEKLEASDAGFEVVSIIHVHDELQEALFRAKESQISFSNNGDSNTQTLYHVTKGSLEAIVREGLDPRLSAGGFFGRGLYFTTDPIKGNDYSPQKGSPTSLRAMLRCRVALGKARVFPTGHFDRQLTRETPGCHSTQGFIRRAVEHVVYQAPQALVTEIILYRFTNTELELAPSLALPTAAAPSGAFTVLITAALSEFFSKLQARAGPDGSEKGLAVRRAIGDLLRRVYTVDQFVNHISTTLGAAPPKDMATKLTTELAKCKLPLPAGPTSPPIIAPAPIPAAIPAAIPATTTPAITTPTTIPTPNPLIPAVQPGTLIQV